MTREWQAQAEQIGVAERVGFLGDVPDTDLPRLYASADIFVLPASSRAEAFGMVLLEAMASGLPCITTEVGSGTSFVVRDGESGLVVPPENPAALENALQKLLENESLRKQMGKLGKERVRSEFSVEKMVSRVEAVYVEVLNPAP